MARLSCNDSLPDILQRATTLGVSLPLMEDTYSQLINYLEGHGAQYRLIDHPPEGRTEIVSPLRGNALVQAAKCIILMVKIGKKVTKYVLSVVPGNARVNMNAIKTL